MIHHASHTVHAHADHNSQLVRYVKKIFKVAHYPTSKCWLRKWPIGPRRPNIFKSTNPVATGGNTSGKVTTVSTKSFPGQRYRSSNQAVANPTGRISNVLNAQTASVKRTICHSMAGTTSSKLHNKAISF